MINIEILPVALTFFSGVLKRLGNNSGAKRLLGSFLRNIADVAKPDKLNYKPKPM